MKRAIVLSIFIWSILPFGCAQLLDNYDISTSPNGIIPMPSGLPSAYSSFVKYTKIQAPNGQAVHFIAQDAITDAQMLRARNILQFYLTNLPGSEYGVDKTAVLNQMGTNEAILMLLNGSDGDVNPPNVFGQPLYQNEMAVEGHAWYINNDFEEHRDASFEEILHLMHDTGIGVDGPNSFPGVLADYQAEIRAAQENAATDNFSIWPIGASGSNPGVAEWYNELSDENSLTQEYLASVVDSYYGLWGPWTETSGGMWGIYIAKTRSEIEMLDPIGYALMPKYFSPFININMDIDPSFNGTFTMAYDVNQAYTHKSQYLQHCTLTGMNASNLKGNDEYNRLTGNVADNTLEGGKGNDRLDGNEGMDIAIFTGNQSEYTVAIQGDMTIVSDNTNDRDGVDTLLNIESMRYADGDVQLTTATKLISIDQEVRVFPNPAADFFQVEWEIAFKDGASINLFDQAGQLIQSDSLFSNERQYQFSTLALSAGIYWVELIDRTRVARKKIVLLSK
ncbi:MAG: T9SS type A sorting domain-containing protein [Chitinophagales bacterium]|nr:T9SS type A sorting domain-containing protein [Chitinophagales bacterium]